MSRESEGKDETTDTKKHSSSEVQSHPLLEELIAIRIATPIHCITVKVVIISIFQDFYRISK